MHTASEVDWFLAAAGTLSPLCQCEQLSEQRAAAGRAALGAAAARGAAAAAARRRRPADGCAGGVHKRRQDVVAGRAVGAGVSLTTKAFDQKQATVGPRQSHNTRSLTSSLTSTLAARGRCALRHGGLSVRPAMCYDALGVSQQRHCMSTGVASAVSSRRTATLTRFVRVSTKMT